MFVFLTTSSYPFFQLDPVTKKLKPIELVANGVNKMKKVLSVGDSPAKVREEARNVALP